ncbi:hypothetical protein EY676_00355 [Enterococcus faecalis]|nr:hypothetical protein [Enterococcus faecalis]TQB17688.1 hypothetical protein FKY94_06175 [Enterococcus faecalis]
MLLLFYKVSNIFIVLSENHFNDNSIKNNVSLDCLFFGAQLCLFCINKSLVFPQKNRYFFI